MRNQTLLSLAVALSVVAWPITYPVYSQTLEESEEANFSYGKVISAIPTEIIVSEYDYDRDEEIRVTYAVNQKTELQNIIKVTELNPGDEVEIFYNAVEGKKTATVISRPHIEDNPADDDDEPDSSQDSSNSSHS